MGEVARLEARRSAARQAMQEQRAQAAAPTVEETQQALAAVLKGADPAKRERARQRLAGLLAGVDVRLDDSRRVWCTVRFAAGHTRGVWFDLRGGHQGLWTPDGRVSLKELEAVGTP
jgi:hypothetical protein